MDFITLSLGGIGGLLVAGLLWSGAKLFGWLKLSGVPSTAAVASEARAEAFFKLIGAATAKELTVFEKAIVGHLRFTHGAMTPKASNAPIVTPTAPQLVAGTLPIGGEVRGIVNPTSSAAAGAIQ